MTNNVKVNHCFIDVLKLGKIIIPAYQRAYSWEEKQLEEFISDLQIHQEKEGEGNYYLGHFIFEKNDNGVLEIIDGQQRITTALLFLSACKRLNTHISHEVFEYISNFAVTNYDENAFNQLIDSGLIEHVSTSSQRRMQIAISGGRNPFKGFDSYILQNLDKVDRLIETICDAYISFALYKDKSVAAQIFELHNTRGINLTETEKVKSYLIKQIFLLSSQSQENILTLQKYFSNIYELEEKASENWIKGEMSLDSILMFHLRAVDDGNKTNTFNSPAVSTGDNGSLNYVKEKINKFNNDKEKIINYILNLAKEFNKTVELITNTIPSLDKNNPLIGDVLILDRDRSMTFLLRLLRAENSLEEKILERWERFLFCYEFIYHKGIFYNLDYKNRGDFELIFTKINDSSSSSDVSRLINDYFIGGKNFAQRKLNERSFWSWVIWYCDINDENGKNNKQSTDNWLLNYAYNSWKLIPYLLYKYEVKNCSNNIEKIRNNVIKGNRISIDHIIAKENEQAQKISNNINGIGNLAIITVSENARLQNKDAIHHANTFSRLGLEHTAKQVFNWSNENLSSAIEIRGYDILDFLRSYFVRPIDIWDGVNLYSNHQ